MPRALGGSDDDDNLVMLCKWCHRQAPNHINPEYMQRFIWDTSAVDDYLVKIQAALHYYKKMFDEPIPDGLSYADWEQIRREFFTNERITVHFGEHGKLNAATIAAEMREIVTTYKLDTPN